MQNFHFLILYNILQLDFYFIGKNIKVAEK